MSLSEEAALAREQERQRAAKLAEKNPLLLEAVVVPWAEELVAAIKASGYQAVPVYQRLSAPRDEMQRVKHRGRSGWFLESSWPRGAMYDGYEGHERAIITEDGRVYERDLLATRNVQEVTFRWGKPRGYQGLVTADRHIILCGDPISSRGAPDTADRLRKSIGIFGMAALQAGNVKEFNPGDLHFRGWLDDEDPYA